MDDGNVIGIEYKRRRFTTSAASLTSLISKPKKVWSKEEDETLVEYITINGEGNWNQVAANMSNRSGKQCRERWLNHLSPDVDKREWTEEEDRIICEMRKVVGNQWSLMRKHLVGRSENAIKNRVNAAERCKGVRVKKPTEYTKSHMSNNDNTCKQSYQNDDMLMGENESNKNDIRQNKSINDILQIVTLPSKIEKWSKVSGNSSLPLREKCLLYKS